MVFSNGYALARISDSQSQEATTHPDEQGDGTLLLLKYEPSIKNRFDPQVIDEAPRWLLWVASTRRQLQGVIDG